MDLLVFAPLALVVVAGLAWWWTGRSDDPANSVDSFSRALTAMQPTSGRPDRGRRQDEDAEDAEAPAAR